jgi:predicted transcriptional regulator of viral defense system
MLSRSTFTNAWFFARHPVFTTGEFADANERTKRESKHSLLAYNRRSGRLLNIRRGLYAVVPDGMDAESYMVNPFLVAGRATSDAVLAYHAALQFHGYAYSHFNTMTYLTTQKETKKFTFQGTAYIGVTQPKILMRKDEHNFGVDVVDQLGMDLRVTCIERTLVDCFDRIDLAGGIEEVWRSLQLVPYLRMQRVLDYLVLMDNAVTTAKVGLFLETYKEHFRVKDEDLAFLRSRRPLHRCYMFPGEHGGKLVYDWNLIVPLAVLERAWEEPL